MTTRLLRLLRHMRWADDRTARSLRALATPPEGAVRVFAHLATAEQIHLERMQGEDPFPQDFWPEHSLDEASAIAERAVRGWEALVHEADPGRLERPVSYRNSSGTRYETAPVRVLTHVSLHGEHHRGQIARIVRSEGGEPARTDLLFFLRERPNEPEGRTGEPPPAPRSE